MSLLPLLATFLVTLTFMTWSTRFSRLLRKRKRRSSDDIDIMASFPRKEVSQEDSRLLQLPDEILISVVSFLDFEDLLTARLTSSHLNELAQPFIYSELDISHGYKAERIAKLIRADDRKAKWLKSVLVSTKHEHDEGLAIFPEQLRRMRNLRQLILETPDCNARASPDRIKWLQLQEQYEQIFLDSSVTVPCEERLLPVLESCTMHFVDKFVSLYPMPLYKSIFLHPTLQDLTMSCTCTDQPGLFSDFRKHERSTVLTHLHLEECDFDPETLIILLKVPRALKSLKLSEGIRYSNDFSDRTSRMHGNMNPGLFSRALSRSVANSLESLSISLGYKRRHGQSIHSPNGSLNFTSLHRLKFLEVSISSLGLLISRPGCDHALYTRLPPSIEHISVFGMQLLVIRTSPAIPFEKCVLADKKGHGLPNLQQVTYRYEHSSFEGDFNQSIFHEIRRREDTFKRIKDVCSQKIISYSDKHYHIFKDAGVRVILELEVTPKGFIPPYLHHEEKPKRSVIWDSNNPTYEARFWEGKARREMRKRLAQAASNQEDADSISDDDNLVERDEEVDLLSELPAHGAELFHLVITGDLSLNALDED